MSCQPNAHCETFSFVTFSGRF